MADIAERKRREQQQATALAQQKALQEYRTAQLGVAQGRLALDQQEADRALAAEERQELARRQFADALLGSSTPSVMPASGGGAPPAPPVTPPTPGAMDPFAGMDDMLAQLTPVERRTALEIANTDTPEAAWRFITKAVEPDAFERYKAMSPADRQMWREYRTQIMREQPTREQSAAYSTQYGDAGTGYAWVYDGQGNHVYDTHVGVSGQPEQVPRRTQIHVEPLGSDASQSAALVDQGLNNLDVMEDLEAALNNTWGPLDRISYAYTIPNTDAGNYARRHLDTTETISKLRTGAGSNVEEQVATQRVFMHHFLATDADRRAQRIHAREALNAYSRARIKQEREGLRRDEPLRNEAEIARQAQQAGDKAVRAAGLDPVITPDKLQRPGYRFTGYDADQDVFLYTQEIDLPAGDAPPEGAEQVWFNPATNTQRYRIQLGVRRSEFLK